MCVDRIKKFAESLSLVSRSMFGAFLYPLISFKLYRFFKEKGAADAKGFFLNGVSGSISIAGFVVAYFSPMPLIWEAAIVYLACAGYIFSLFFLGNLLDKKQLRFPIWGEELQGWEGKR